MDAEASPIQVLTAPKEEEVGSFPEPNEPTEPIETEEKMEGKQDEPENGNLNEDAARQDEIVVEDEDNAVEQQNGKRNGSSHLSSAPDSEGEGETSKPRNIPSHTS